MAEKIPLFNISKYFARIVSSQFSVCIVCLLALYNDHPEKSDYEVMVKNPELQVR